MPINFCDGLVWKNLVEEIFAINQFPKAFAEEILVNKGQNHKNKFHENYLLEKYLFLRLHCKSESLIKINRLINPFTKDFSSVPYLVINST